MTINLYGMVSLKVWMCLLVVVGARARSAPPAPAGCQWDYSDAKLSESNFLTCNIKTIGSADFLFKNITTAQAYNINKLKLTCTDLLFFESSLHMNTGSFLGQLRKLEDLSIEYCKIRYVPATVLSPLRDLTSLTLRSYNTDWPAMTMEFHAESFRGLMELRSLDLGDNNIYTLPSEVFCPLFSLESLNLTNNRIQDISDIGFSDWGKGPIAPGAGYTDIPEKIPMDATELYLDGNDFGSLSSHLFIGKKKLHKLYLNNSNIATIDNDTLNGLHSLNVLHLENNHLTELSGGEFSQLKHLRELYLNDNLLTSVANKTFENLSSLRVAHLQGNKILDVDKKLTHMIHLENINVRGNIFTCNCDNVLLLQNWFKKNYEDPADMFCADENGLTSNMTVFDVIDKCHDSSVLDNTIPTENQLYQYDEVTTIKLNFVPLLAVVLISCVQMREDTLRGIRRRQLRLSIGINMMLYRHKHQRQIP
ncbi:unnamed protein product [Chilo suppressalis]|uniref:LRRCT domain-containing protein n=1 Tax=Chilo suppressalis TaxID=168631 RepID=A0ABN8B308_CHISP|nr:unnamed protein product [Chilo suppressalis]